MLICGIDEAGRGPIAGPVTAAAVILADDGVYEGLRDSKKLTAAARERLDAMIRESAVAWAIGWASHVEIDRVNILAASHLAMRRAVRALPRVADETIVDGSVVPDLGVPLRAVVKADATVPAVMAASILAKTARDRWMAAYATIEPAYEYERHKGYPTPRHKEVVLARGPSAIQRLTFAVR